MTFYYEDTYPDDDRVWGEDDEEYGYDYDYDPRYEDDDYVKNVIDRGSYSNYF